MTGNFIAVDWGTTNRRIYLIDGAGEVLATERDDMGVQALAPADFPAAAATIRARFGDLPMVCAGMVGSQRGWAFVPYVACPASLRQLGEALTAVEAGRSYIVPGVCDPRGDVMRGEEVQLLGAVADGLAPDDALICQPGTHCKWARMGKGSILGLSTAMTGEMFAMLRQHSLLAEFLDGVQTAGDAFREGLQRGGEGDLLTALFGVRGQAILGMRPVADCADYASGILIGADVAGQGIGKGTVVHVLADPELGRLYSLAIAHAGGDPLLVDSHAAFVAGISRIWSHYLATAS